MNTSSLEFKADAQALVFVEKICNQMMEQFEISRDEAVAKINETWRGAQIEGEEHIFYHETIGYWANTHYYGKDSGWWLPFAEREEYQREMEDESHTDV